MSLSPRFAWAAALLFPAGLAAQPLFQTNFEGAKGASPAGFAVSVGAGSSDAALNGNGDFRMTLGANVLALHEGPGAASFSDGEITVVLRIGNQSPNLYAGVVGRHVDSSRFYHARLIGLVGGGWGLQLFRFSNGVTQLGETVPVTYATPFPCRLEFRFVGPELTVQLFDAAVGGRLLGRLQANDETLQTGSIGLRATSSGLPIAFESFAYEALEAVAPASAAPAAKR